MPEGSLDLPCSGLPGAIAGIEVLVSEFMKIATSQIIPVKYHNKSARNQRGL
jgi:hypothetical protein